MKKREPAGSMVTKVNFFDVILYIFLFAFMLTVIYPFWDLLMRSLSPPESSGQLGFALFPTKFTFDSYMAVFNGGNVGVNYFNTIFRTVVGTVGSLLITSLCAYGLSETKLPYRSSITFFFVFTMFFGGGMIPSYLLVKELHMIDTIWALIVPGLASVYNMVMLRNYMQRLDKSLEESAMLDGAGQFTILFKIIIPVCKPILATVALWVMVGHWNAWFDAMLYTNKPNLEVLQLALQRLLQQSSSTELQKFQTAAGESASSFTTESLKSAQIFISIVPILCAYPFLQRYFVKGIMVGSFKG